MCDGYFCRWIALFLLSFGLPVMNPDRKCGAEMPGDRVAETVLKRTDRNDLFG